MPDISMCRVDNCKLSTTCYRHEDSGTVPCEFRQAYILFPEDHDTETCKYYWTYGKKR